MGLRHQHCSLSATPQLSHVVHRPGPSIAYTPWLTPGYHSLAIPWSTVCHYSCLLCLLPCRGHSSLEDTIRLNKPQLLCWAFHQHPLGPPQPPLLRCRGCHSHKKMLPLQLSPPRSLMGTQCMREPSIAMASSAGPSTSAATWDPVVSCYDHAAAAMEAQPEPVSLSSWVAGLELLGSVGSFTIDPAVFSPAEPPGLPVLTTYLAGLWQLPPAAQDAWVIQYFWWTVLRPRQELQKHAATEVGLAPTSGSREPPLPAVALPIPLPATPIPLTVPPMVPAALSEAPHSHTHSPCTAASFPGTVGAL